MHKKSLNIALVLLGLSFVLPAKSYAIKDSTKLIKVYEDSLKVLQFGRINPNNTDKQRADTNALFLVLFKKALSLPNSFDYAFDSLYTISKAEAPDKTFRLITWNMPISDGTQKYYGFMQVYDSKKKTYNLFPLIDKSSEIVNPQTATYTPDKWLGMLYYKVVDEKVGDKMTYTLLAWQGYSKLVTRKIIDYVSFSSTGEPSFGKAMFSKLPSEFKGSPKRIIFQYAQTSVMILKYDSKKNMILFDKLGPTEPDLIGQYQYYGPSFQIDGLAFNNGTWEYKINVDARNTDRGNDKNFRDPEDNNYKVNKKAIYAPR